MNINDDIGVRLGRIDWPKAYEYHALQVVEELIKNELDRRRGAEWRYNRLPMDKSTPHLEALQREIRDRATAKYKEAYQGEETN